MIVVGASVNCLSLIQNSAYMKTSIRWALISLFSVRWYGVHLADLYTNLCWGNKISNFKLWKLHIRFCGCKFDHANHDSKKIFLKTSEFSLKLLNIYLPTFCCCYLSCLITNEFKFNTRVHGSVSWTSF